jgi:hypothetical protein
MRAVPFRRVMFDHLSLSISHNGNVNGWIVRHTTGISLLQLKEPNPYRCARQLREDVSVQLAPSRADDWDRRLTEVFDVAITEKPECVG